MLANNTNTANVNRPRLPTRRRLSAPKRPPVAPLFEEMTADPEALLRRFRILAERDAEENATGFVEEALPVMAHLTPRFAFGLRKRGKLREEAYLGLALAAWKKLHGTSAPGEHGVDPQLVEYFNRLVNTARLFLLAYRFSEA